MSARGRTPRDRRRRELGQNFLHADLADRLAAEADITSGELVVDVGAGVGALTFALARHGAEVVAIEMDAVWAARLRTRARQFGARIRVVQADFRTWPLPTRPFRVFACPPFGMTTVTLRRLLDDPTLPLTRADLIVQDEVATKRATVPPSTLLSTVWAPWWDVQLGRRVPARAFRPVPRVDAAILIVRRRERALLPTAMAGPYATFVRAHWPFPAD